MQTYQSPAGDCQAACTTLEASQCQLRQQVCTAAQMQYIVLFALFVCVLLFVVSLYYDTAQRHSYCVNCRHHGLDFDFTADRIDRDGLFS